MQSLNINGWKLFLLAGGFILLLMPAWAQSTQIVSGKVTDENGQALPGVTVLVKGTQNGTTTSAEGTYRLSVSVTSDMLVASCVGYVTQEVAVGDRTVIDFKLAPDSKILNEVVVV